MSNKKQSSVEWFAIMLAEQGLLITKDYKNLITYKEAKAMHKEEVTDAYIECWMNDGGNGFHKVKEAEQYYNETFGGQDE